MLFWQVKVLSRKEQLESMRFDLGPDADDLAVFRKKGYISPLKRHSLFQTAEEHDVVAMRVLSNDCEKMV